MVTGRRRRLQSYATTTTACEPNSITTTTFPGCGLFDALHENVCAFIVATIIIIIYLYIYTKINVFFSYQTVETGLLPLMNVLRAYAVHAI